MGRPKSSGSRHRLGEPLDSKLADFSAAIYGTDEIKIIRQAVEEHIDRQLEANAGIKREYENIRRKRIEAARTSNGKLLRPVGD